MAEEQNAPVSAAPAREYYGYPEAIRHDINHSVEKGPSNPALRGAALKLSASLLPKIPGLPSMFYKNAGSLKIARVDGLGSIDARYEPTVIPTATHHLASGTGASYTELSALTQHEPKKDGKFYSVLDIHEAFKSGKTTPSELVEKLLPLIQRNVKNASKHSTAWLDTNLDIVRAAANASTERWKAGKPLGVLDGVPIGVKDEADLKGYYKKCMGSKLDFTNPLDETSWCVAKWEEEGAIVLGKLNMHGTFNRMCGSAVS